MYATANLMEYVMVAQYVMSVKISEKKNLIQQTNNMELAMTLTEALDRVISPKDLEKKTDKQLWYLKALCENVLTPNESRFYYKSKEESIAIIKDILGIKSKMVDKKEGYLINKKLI
jgi:hypothetical protein